MAKGDFLDRKIESFIDVIERVFKLALQDTRTLIIVLSISANIYLIDKVISTNEKMRDEVIKEVRRQVVPQVKRETSEQLGGISLKVDTILNNAKEVTEKLKSR